MERCYRCGNEGANLKAFGKRYCNSCADHMEKGVEADRAQFVSDANTHREVDDTGPWHYGLKPYTGARHEGFPSQCGECAHTSHNEDVTRCEKLCAHINTFRSYRAIGPYEICLDCAQRIPLDGVTQTDV